MESSASVLDRSRFSITSLMSETLSYPLAGINVGAPAGALTSQMDYYPTWTHAPAAYASGLKGMEGTSQYNYLSLDKRRRRRQH